MNFYFQMHLQRILWKCAIYPFVITIYAAWQYGSMFVYFSVVWHFIFNVYIHHNIRIYSMIWWSCHSSGGERVAFIAGPWVQSCVLSSGPEAYSSLRFFGFPCYSSFNHLLHTHQLPLQMCHISDEAAHYQASRLYPSTYLAIEWGKKVLFRYAWI
jgi:hypothetical protein